MIIYNYDDSSRTNNMYNLYLIYYNYNKIICTICI